MSDFGVTNRAQTAGSFNIFRIFKVRESGNREFWVSNIMIMISTILGVYLAAHAGYKTALEFEFARGEREGYYLKRALLDELKDNVAAVERWSQEFQEHLNSLGAIKANLERLKENNDPELLASAQPWIAWWKAGTAFRFTRVDDNPTDLQLSKFTWETMKQQSSTFQVPATFISAVRRFYSSVETNLKDLSTRNYIMKTRQAPAAIWEDTMKLKNDVLPLLEKEVQLSRKRLEELNIPVR